MYNKLKFILLLIIAFNISNINIYSNEHTLENNHNTIIVPVENENFLRKDYLIPPIGIGKAQDIML